MRMQTQASPATGTLWAALPPQTRSSGPATCIRAAATCCSRMGTSRNSSAAAHVMPAADSGHQARHRARAEEAAGAEEVVRLREVVVAAEVAVRQVAEVHLRRLLLQAAAVVQVRAEAAVA